MPGGVKRFEQSQGLDTALCKTVPLFSVSLKGIKNNVKRIRENNSWLKETHLPCKGKRQYLQNVNIK